MILTVENLEIALAFQGYAALEMKKQICQRKKILQNQFTLRQSNCKLINLMVSNGCSPTKTPCYPAFHSLSVQSVQLKYLIFIQMKKGSLCLLQFIRSTHSSFIISQHSNYCEIITNNTFNVEKYEMSH